MKHFLIDVLTEHKILHSKKAALEKTNYSPLSCIFIYFQDLGGKVLGKIEILALSPVSAMALLCEPGQVTYLLWSSVSISLPEKIRLLLFWWHP